MRSVRVLSMLTFGVLICAFSSVSAQSLGTFRWQLQPFCNVVTLAITQNESSFRLEGTDNQCGTGGGPASAIGTAFLNPDGSVALGLTLVASPGAAPTHVMARIDIATLGGTWQDSGGNAGAFAFTSGAVSGGSLRPPASSIGALTVGPGLRGGGSAGSVQIELATTPIGAFDFSNPNGVEALTAAPPASPFMESLPFRRLLWDPTKAAFRVGAFAGTQLDNATIGVGSVALGLSTIASGEGSLALGLGTIARGAHSVAMGFGTLAAGENSVALGQLVDARGFASLAVGAFVTAGGTTSIALGRAVSATTNGTFMFGDASVVLVDAVPSADNQFVARAAGGTRFFSNALLTAGVELPPGAGAWSSVSDVNMKENFRELDGGDVLLKIARMPIREWSYKAQEPAVRHVGPTAQDFHAAFGLGEDPLKISTIDADGVALRAIQALEARTRTQHANMLEDTQALADENHSLVQENAERIAEIATLKVEIVALRARLDALEAKQR